MTKLVSKYQNPSKPIKRTRILFTPKQMALFESQATRVPGMNINSNYTVGEEAKKAGEASVRQTNRRNAEEAENFNRRNEMRSRVPVGERSGEVIYETRETGPKVIGMSGSDPLLGTLFDFYVGGKALEGIGKLGLWGAAKYAPGTLLGNWSRGYFINNEMKLVNPFEESVKLGITLRATTPTGQRRIVSEDTYPMYRGKQHSVNEVVNPDGTVNPRQAMKILHEVSELFPGSYRMERRLENRRDHQTDPTTYDHTKNVTSSAWNMEIPEGFTKQDLMIAALGHDFGKIVAGDGHAQIGADLARQVFPDLTDAQYTAIAEHMGTPKTLLGKATKAADIDNGRSVGLNFSPLTDTYVETYKLNNSVGLSNDLELYALRDNTGGNSKITTSDVYKSLIEAEEYKGSKGYKDLVHRAQKEAKEMGLPFSSDLYLGVNNYFPSIKLSSRPKGKLGGYRKSTNTIELDPDLLSPIEGKYVPFHEGLHWLRVGTPEMNSPLYNRWKLNMKDELAWHDFYHSKEHSKLKYEDNAKAYARKKVKEALYEDADPYLSIPGELLINGLEAGRAIGLEPFAEYPGYGKALEAAEKARNYNKWLHDVKAGTTLEMLNFWKILTGNYIPSVSIPLTTGYTLYNIFNRPQQQLQYLKQGGKINAIELFKQRRMCK